MAGLVFPASESSKLIERGGIEMKTRKRENRAVLVTVAAVCLLALPAVAAADVDLSIASVSASYDGNELTLAAEVKMEAHGSIGPISADVRFYLDDQLVLTDPFDAEDLEVDTCQYFSPPNCGMGNCTDKVINGQPASGSCLTLQWGEDDPFCGCVYLVISPGGTAAYNDQTTCSVVVDEDDNVQEGDETNNVQTISLEPVPTEKVSWSAIKALYR